MEEFKILYSMHQGIEATLPAIEPAGLVLVLPPLCHDLQAYFNQDADAMKQLLAPNAVLHAGADLCGRCTWHIIWEFIVVGMSRSSLQLTAVAGYLASLCLRHALGRQKVHA